MFARDLPYAIHTTEHAGRCLKATRLISKGTVILRTRSPVLAIVMRDYRKEVCAHCFRYDRGRSLPMRVVPTGKSFCSEKCRTLWEEKVNIGFAEVAPKMEGADAGAGLGVKSWEIVESLVKQKGSTNGAQDVTMHEAGSARPSELDIVAAWADVEELGKAIREARAAEARGGHLNKKQRKGPQQALENKSRICDPDALSFLLTGVLLRARTELSSPQPLSQAAALSNSINHARYTNGTAASASTIGFSAFSWTQLLTLASTSTPYPTRHNLHSHTSAYLILLALLPHALLPFVTASTLRAIPTHETRNSFGIRSLDDSGSEFLGYGVWPDASLFNHSCAPNVGKARGHPRSISCLRRGSSRAGPYHGEYSDESQTRLRVGEDDEREDGRTWTFWTSRDVAAGEELCISYLGGEEEELDVQERRKRLRDTWGFECNCVNCVRDAATLQDIMEMERTGRDSY